MERKRASLIAAAALVCVPLLMGNTSCSGPQVSSSGAMQVGANQIVPKNTRGRTVEQQNIEDRIRVTTDPTKVMWIHLISLDGKVIKRMPIRNKVTSSGKRLEPKHATGHRDGGYMPNSGVKVPGHSDVYFATDELLQPDGTFGDSDNYVFWFDPMGRYHQYGTAGGIGYLLTDYPIDLENPMDKVTGLYNVHQQAKQWQDQQEAELRKKESKK